VLLEKRQRETKMALAELERARRDNEARARQVEQARAQLDAQSREIAVRAQEAEQARASAEARAREVEQARATAEMRAREVEQARATAEARAREVEQARLQAEAEARAATQAQQQAEQARQQAEQARLQAEAARVQTEVLTRELADLKARQTERGLELTMGDVLFAFGKADLAPGSQRSLAKLAEFLQKHQKRAVIIEGHTDSTGPEDLNMTLSQQRADAVKSVLVDSGVAGTRIVTRGYGFQYPVAPNDTAVGRQQNRRVELIVLDDGVDPQGAATR
jgi:outer membrane protein OmpA-like peptidoglycan-associated protein